MKIETHRIRTDIFLSGEKVALRVLREQDLEVWYQWFNDSDVTEYMNKGFSPNSMEKQKAYFEQLLKSEQDLQLGIQCAETEDLIGVIGLHKIDWVHRRGDISIVIGNKAYWGKGLAKEAVSLLVKHAFWKLNLQKVTAGMSSANEGSKRCFEENGFQIEGVTRKHFFYKGNFIDGYQMGLLRDECDSESTL